MSDISKTNDDCMWPPQSDDITDNNEVNSDEESESQNCNAACGNEQASNVCSDRPAITLGTSMKELKKLTVHNMPKFTNSPWRTFNKHVRMPHKYPWASPPESSRWKAIEGQLKHMRLDDDNNFLKSFSDVIFAYNGSYRTKWDMQGIAMYNEGLNHEEKKDFIRILSRMGALATKLQDICSEDVPLLLQKNPGTIQLTRLQIACLLANAFFCTFPSRNVDPVKRKGNQSRRSDGLPIPTINFNSLFKLPDRNMDSHMNKIRCIMNYFKRVTGPQADAHSEWSKEYVTFERRVLRSHVDWERSEAKFSKLHVTSEGTIEDDGRGFVHVDFANKLVGGGVLGRGCVQEEIRFLGCTELIVSRLFTEELLDDECLVVSGCEQYNNYKGYSSTFEWTGDCFDETKKDKYGRRLVQIIVMDAHRYFDTSEQYQMRWVTRELNKAFCGFDQKESELEGHDSPAAIATGNWGCGDFRGNRHLKSVIQLMAAAQAKRDICYFTHHDQKLVEDMFDVHQLFCNHDITVGCAYNLIKTFAHYILRPGFEEVQLYEFIRNCFKSGPPPSDHRNG